MSMKCSQRWHFNEPGWRTFAAIVLAGALVGLHFVQLYSPLRLNTDACRLLNMAVSAAEGRGFLVHGQSDVLPSGYPATVLLLMKLGAGTTFWINALNFVALLTGCGLLFLMTAWLEDVRNELGLRVLLCILPLAAWVSIKHVSLPLTESLYTAVSMASAAALIACWESRRTTPMMSWLAIGIVLAWYAMKVRTVGVSLFGASALTVSLHPRMRHLAARFCPKSACDRWSLAGASIACLALALVVLRFASLSIVMPGNGYLREQSDALQSGIGRFMGNVLSMRLQEAGEVFLNIPASKFARLGLVFNLVGAVAVAVCGLGWWRLRRELPPLAFYMAFYCVVIFFWPFYDVRFWMPLLPALVLCVWLAVQPLLQMKWMWFGALTYLCIFFGLGFVALFFSVRISLASPRKFAEIYGDGSYRASYRVAFGAAETGSSAVNADVIDLLRSFDARAHAR
jgi:hypothetical protein